MSLILFLFLFPLVALQSLIDDSDGSISYVGNWFQLNPSNSDSFWAPRPGAPNVSQMVLRSANDHSIHCCLEAECRVEFTFRGSSISLQSWTGPLGGSILVTLDDQPPSHINLNRPTDQIESSVWQSSDELDSSVQHRLTIAPDTSERNGAGFPNESGTTNGLNVDAFRVGRSQSSTPPSSSSNDPGAAVPLPTNTGPTSSSVSSSAPSTAHSTTSGTDINNPSTSSSTAVDASSTSSSSSSLRPGISSNTAASSSSSSAHHSGLSSGVIAAIVLAIVLVLLLSFLLIRRRLTNQHSHSVLPSPTSPSSSHSPPLFSPFPPGTHASVSPTNHTNVDHLIPPSQLLRPTGKLELLSDRDRYPAIVPVSMLHRDFPDEENYDNHRRSIDTPPPPTYTSG